MAQVSAYSVLKIKASTIGPAFWIKGVPCRSGGGHGLKTRPGRPTAPAGTAGRVAAACGGAQLLLSLVRPPRVPHLTAQLKIETGRMAGLVQGKDDLARRMAERKLAG
jgi:hypothetical protein